MGPWFIRDATKPHGPGCSLTTLRALIARGVIKPSTVLRGPTTNQFWTPASRVPGVAHLLGACHACSAPAKDAAFACAHCGAGFHAPEDRQHMGLMEARALPGEASATRIAALAGDAFPLAPQPQPASTRPAETPVPYPDIATTPRFAGRSAPSHRRPFAAWLLGVLLLIGFGAGGWSLRGLVGKPSANPGLASTGPNPRAGDGTERSRASDGPASTSEQGGGSEPAEADSDQRYADGRELPEGSPDRYPPALAKEIPAQVEDLIRNGDIAGASATVDSLLEDSPSQGLDSIGQSLDTALTAEMLRSLP